MRSETQFLLVIFAGTSDTIGIQDGTGLVWVTRVLDREAEPSVSVMIKVRLFALTRYITLNTNKNILIN